MVKTNKGIVKAIGVGLIGVLVGSLGAGLVAYNNPRIVVEETEVTVEKIVEVPVEVEKVVEKEVPVEVEVIKEVEDNSFVVLACDRLVYDDIAECKEEVIAEDAALQIAIEEIKEKYADELEDADIVKDEDDVQLVTVYDDFEDINVIKSNFDRDKYVFEIEAKIDDDDLGKESIVFRVRVEDGEAEIENVRQGRI